MYYVTYMTIELGSGFSSECDIEQTVYINSEPLKPLLQTQIKEPGVFWHVASLLKVLISQ